MIRKRPLLLDCGCSAGGGAMGYHRAGFDVLGIDIKPQPRFPFLFIQTDMLDFLEKYGREFDVIHASPPCQAYSVLRHLAKKTHPMMIEPVRELLKKSGRPYIIENVVGAPLIEPIRLCGSSFGLDLRRHRLFETNWPCEGKSCDHAWQTPRFPANRSDRRKAGCLARVIVVAGHDTRNFNHLASVVSPHGGIQEAGGVAEWKRAMEIDWMIRDELSQAIPPVYTLHIGKQILELLRTA